MTTKLAKVVTDYEEHPIKKLHKPSITYNAYVHKTYQDGDFEEFPPIHLHDPSMRQSCKVT